MATKFIVQKTNGAYAGNIPELAWHDVSAHRSSVAANRAVERLSNAMYRRTSGNGWDENHRIVERD